MSTRHGITGLLPQRSGQQSRRSWVQNKFSLCNEILSQRKQNKCYVKWQYMHTWRVIKKKVHSNNNRFCYWYCSFYWNLFLTIPSYPISIHKNMIVLLNKLIPPHCSCAKQVLQFEKHCCRLESQDWNANL